MEIADVSLKNAIHCATQEEFTRIGNLITAEFKMFSNPDYFINYRSKSCLYIDGGYGDLSWAKLNEYTVLKSTEITA